ncbi:MAG: hypothetical protein FJ279_26875 [Planctomycetes bacterium]|nr:hypothetical protein [Planctomycetota bacterium]
MKQLREKTAELESRLAELQRAEQDAFLEGWLEEQEKIAAKTYPLLNRDHVRAKLFFSPEVRSGDGDYAALGKVFQRLAAESHKQQEAAFETYMKRRTAAGKPKGPAVGGQGGGASSAGGAAASNQPPLGLEGDGKFNLIRLVASKMRGT